MKSRLPQGFGNSKADMMQKYAKMQELLRQKTQQIEESQFKGTAGGGVVCVVANGKKEILSLDIKPEIVNPDDIEMLQDLVIGAINEAFRQVDEITDKELGQLTNSFSVPGLI